METITFLVHGKTATTRSEGASHDLLKNLPAGQIKQSVQIGTLRGTDSGVTMSAEPGKDVVVIHIANGPSLMLHPENARDLFKAQEGTLVASRSGTSAFIQVPSSLGWSRQNAPVQQRGLVDKVVIAGIDVLTGVSSESAANVAAGLVVAKVDDQVDPGVYLLPLTGLAPLKGKGALLKVDAASDGGPLLVLLHGTFSDTHGTFGKLWEQHPALVTALFKRYDNRVYGLDHPTLGASPIGNALLLARTLPQGARLHLLTHSRGGLVGEVLARACSIDKLSGQDLALFDGAAYAQDRADLAELVKLVQQRAIRVERIVRVACPARGTLLASKRLDAYISVLKWTLELARIPVLPALVGFLGDVAQNKSDPGKIPGLAAQMPDSPLVTWLHAASQPIAGELRVVAGDVEGDSIGSWIKTLLTDAYYWTDNDFVVQTSSMYGGAPRAAGATFVLDRGGKVSHFTYFSNPMTAGAVVLALTEEAPDGFRIIGPLSAAGQDSSGARGPRKVDANRPAVFVLPGILGSNLKVDGDRIWLGWRMINGLDHLKYDGPGSASVEPDGPVGITYSKLCKFLSATHDVIEFAFDWRKPIEWEAKRLAIAIEKELDLREKSKQPVRLLAHSMGGLVARVMQLDSKEIWNRMVARTGASVLMLGTPNGGSWAPMQVLSGDDSFGNALVAFGAPFRDGEARALMATFPGFLQLQAGLLDPALRLDRESTWRELADSDMRTVQKNSVWHSASLQLRAFAWGVPSQPVLDAAIDLRKRLDAQRDSGALSAKDKLVMVVGQAKFTPDGYTFQDDGLVYLDAPDQGDGRVTLASALLPGVPAWQIDCEHGKLPADEDSFDGYLELLQTGKTSLLGRKLDPAALKEIHQDRSRCLPNRASRRAPSGPPAMIEHLDAEAGRTLDEEVTTPALAVTVVNGNIKFVRQPLMLGHYRSSLLTGAEHVMNQLIGGSMAESIKMGLYPDGVRTHQIFLNLGEDEQNPLQLPRPESVIIVGLGPEGELSADALAATVCSGVIGWAQRLAETHIAKLDSFEVAATLIGSGGPGISAAQSARSIAQGVIDANAHLFASQWPHVSHLHLTELYHDRATDAWRALRLLSDSSPGRYRVDDRITSGTGAHRRALDTGYRGASYDLMSALSDDSDARHDSVIVYTLDTKRAREDVRAQRMQGPLIKMLLKTASSGTNNDKQLGCTLFKLLVPPEVEPFMAGTADMQLTLDKGTAGIPWEMLDTSAGKANSADKRPWAIRVKLLRRLRTVEQHPQVTDAGIDGDILVIGEPKCNGDYARLPGAWREARAVVDTIRKGRPEATVKALISEAETDFGFDASQIINTVFDRDWRIVHIAGHGAAASLKSRGGVVLSDGTYFGPNEISTMRVVPSLVFINCCHLGAQDPNALLEPDSPFAQDRPTYAANVAEELIKKGVRCVIAAGWAVDDDAALAFATTFYEQLVDGQRFIDAVAAARTAAWKHDTGGTTWAAYQCYGDPNWYLKRPFQDTAPPMPLAEEFAGIGSAPALTLALETVITNARYQDENRSDCWNKVHYLELRFEAAWGSVGVVAEAFGLAWAEARDLESAIKWNRRAIAASDGSATICALEQLGNVLVLAAWEGVWDMQEHKPDPADKEWKAAMQSTVETARERLKEAVLTLERLNSIQTNLERQSLLGSAFKRIAMVEKSAHNEKAWIAAIAQMEQHYGKAEDLGRSKGGTDWFYPALNKIAAQVIAHVHHPAKHAFAPTDTDEVAHCIETRIHDDPDFQSVVGRVELRFYCALATGSARIELGKILEQYDDLFLRAKAPRYWNSVRDQLDFVFRLCQDVLADGETEACEQLMQRLLEIAPRPRSRRAGGQARKGVPVTQLEGLTPLVVPA